MDRQGWAVFIGTMKGKNHFYKMLERARTEENWHYMELKGSQSGILRQEDLAELRAQLTEAQYEQEIECNPNAAVMGTYYSEIIAKMEIDGSIGDYPHDPTKQVFVSADLGFTDSSAWWFWQLDERGPILIDYFEDASQPLQHYFNMLEGHPYDYAEVWLPHDAKARSMQTGRSTIEQLRDRGLPCKPVPKLAVQHGIDAARLILPTCRIDKNNCEIGIEALRAYRRKWNDKTQQFSDSPLHDWSSNGSDAFRMFALVTEEGAQLEEEVEVQESGVTLDQLWKDKEDNSWKAQILRI
jgi:hypothetical protein